MENKTGLIDVSYKGILKVALPISLSTFVQFIVVFTDNLMLSRVSENALNAAGNAGLLYLGISMAGVGFSSGVQILIARRYAEHDHEKVGSSLANSIWLAAGIGIAIFALMQFIQVFMLEYIIADQTLLGAMHSFMDVRNYGLLIYPITLTLMGFHSGIARTSVLLLVAVSIGLVNLIGDYILIFGKFGFEAMNEKGAAMASFGAEIVGLIILLIHISIAKHLKPLNFWNRIWNFPFADTAKIMRLSLPLIGQQFLAVTTWTTFYFMVEKMGQKELMVSHVTRAVYFLAFITIFGISQTTRTYISALIAESRQHELIPVMKKMIIINLAGVFLLSHGMVFYPETLAAIFSQDQYTIELTANVLRVISGATIVFSFTSVFLYTVEGSGLTRQALYIELSAIIIYLITSYLSIFKYPQPIHIVWANDYVYFMLIGLLSLIVLYKYNWKYKQV
jgi:putative MATE family efflux protein